VESREQLRITLTSIGDGVMVVDAESKVMSLNGEAEGLTGWREAEAIGRPLTEVFRIVNEDTGEPAENPVKKVLREGGTVGLANHTVLISKDGVSTPIDDSATFFNFGRGSKSLYRQTEGEKQRAFSVRCVRDNSR
jgi:PAS domain S-box-containing protein